MANLTLYHASPSRSSVVLWMLEELGEPYELKLLNLDSSFAARKELAKELGYTGDTGDSASMNIWLHKQVMQKLAANGGKVPADLAG